MWVLSGCIWAVHVGLPETWKPFISLIPADNFCAGQCQPGIVYTSSAKLHIHTLLLLLCSHTYMITALPNTLCASRASSLRCCHELHMEMLKTQCTAAVSDPRPLMCVFLDHLTVALQTRDCWLQIKCCLLMLDFDNDDMVCDLFKIMLDTVK